MRVALLLLALPAVAFARQRAVVVPEIEIQGPIDDAARSFFVAGIVDGVEATGAGLVAPNTLRAALTERPDLSRCADDRCLLALAAATRADAVVLGVAKKDAVRGDRERARYEVQLRLYDAASAEFTSAEEERCARCTEEELQALLRVLARRLFEHERRPATAPLEVVSTPPGAEVRIDGRLLGLTDLKQTIAVGPHEVTVERRGLPGAHAGMNLITARGARLSVRWAGSGDPTVRVEDAIALAAAVPGVVAGVTAPPPPASAKRPGWKLAVAGAATVIGAVAIAAGIGLLAINHHGTCSAPDGVTCPDRYSTVAGGSVALAGGIAAAAVGVTLFVIRW